MIYVLFLDNDWEVIYGCYVPGVAGLRADNCLYETEFLNNNYGCCLHFNSSGNEELRLTCALDGNLCLGDGWYVTGKKTYDPDLLPETDSWSDDDGTTTPDLWSYNGTTIGIDEPKHSG